MRSSDRTWVSTEIMDRTKTVENTLVSTVTENVVQTQTSVATVRFFERRYLFAPTHFFLLQVTATATQVVKETQLGDCLKRCASGMNPLSAGNSWASNTYANAATSATAAPSYSSSAYASAPSSSSAAGSYNSGYSSAANAYPAAASASGYAAAVGYGYRK
jgi:hypothetical protein